MTVIAYRNGRMACDSLCAEPNSGAVWFKGNKIFRTKSGALVGCSGQADSRAIVTLLNNIKTGRQMPTAHEFAETKVESENGILIVLPDGEVWCACITFDSEGQEWSADCCRITGLGGFAAAGCGAREALVAMRCGKSAREAVALACEYNSHCRPPIYEELLNPVPKPKRKKKRN